MQTLKLSPRFMATLLRAKSNGLDQQCIATARALGTARDGSMVYGYGWASGVADLRQRLPLGARS